MPTIHPAQQAILDTLSPETQASIKRVLQFSDDAKQCAQDITDLFGKLGINAGTGKLVTQHYRDHILGNEHEHDGSVAHAITHLLIAGRKLSSDEGNTVSDNTILDALTTVDIISGVLGTPDAELITSAMRGDATGSTTVH